MIFIITGEKDAGKSTYARRLVSELQDMKLRIEGFLSIGEGLSGSRKRFDLLDLAVMQSWPLCETEMKPGTINCGQYYFNPETIKRGNKIIRDAIQHKADMIVMDEIGRCELDGLLWDSALRKALTSSSGLMLVTASKNVEKIVSGYAIVRFMRIDIAGVTVERAAGLVMENIKNRIESPGSV